MQAFDDLLLLKRGGFATYVGHLGTHSVDLVNYFQVCPSSHRCQQTTLRSHYLAFSAMEGGLLQVPVRLQGSLTGHN